MGGTGLSPEGNQWWFQGYDPDNPPWLHYTLDFFSYNSRIINQWEFSLQFHRTGSKVPCIGYFWDQLDIVPYDHFYSFYSR